LRLSGAWDDFIIFLCQLLGWVRHITVTRAKPKRHRKQAIYRYGSGFAPTCDLLSSIKAIEPVNSPMNRIVLIVLAGFLLTPAWAVQIQNQTPPYNTTEPTNSQITNWTTGWSGGKTGWNYVGQVVTQNNGSASGVYLGNGWVMTAAHVTMGNFVLNGVTYPAVAGSAQSITSGSNTADLLLFQVSPYPDLPVLTLSTNLPAVGDSVALLGYGGGQGLTWGYNSVTAIDQPITPGGYTYVSNDFLTDLTGNNQAILVTGDSGGGDFIYNGRTRKWELTGINEVVGTYTDDQGDTITTSGFVQLDTYANQINAIVGSTPPEVDTPTLPLPGLVLLAGLLFGAAVTGGRRVGV